MSSFGPHTQTDLSNVDCIFGADPKIYDRDTGRLALELAATAYEFDLSPWMEAGFTDITLQVEKHLVTGIRAQEEATFLQSMRNNFGQMLARHITNVQNPLSQIRDLVMKVWESDSGKALVMVRRCENGRILVAVSFAGTGPKLSDWIPNFYFTPQEGFHGGFYAVAQQFMDNADQIFFPSLSEDDENPLSLSDILEDAKKPDSRYFIFASGHSQGSAVMQIWMYYLIKSGVQPQHLLGYGFAAPSVCRAGMDTPEIPAILVANSDDVVARVGLQKHLGTQYLYRVENTFEEKCYGALKDDALYRYILAMLGGIRNTREGLLTALAHVYAMSYLEEDKAAAAMKALSPLPLPGPANQSAHSLFCILRYFVRQAYQDLFGEPDRVELLALAKTYYLVMQKEPGYPDMLVKALWMAHHLYLPDSLSPLLAAYAFIAVRGYTELTLIKDPE